MQPFLAFLPPFSLLLSSVLLLTTHPFQFEPIKTTIHGIPFLSQSVDCPLRYKGKPVLGVRFSLPTHTPPPPPRAAEVQKQPLQCKSLTDCEFFKIMMMGVGQGEMRLDECGILSLPNFRIKEGKEWGTQLPSPINIQRNNKIHKGGDTPVRTLQEKTYRPLYQLTKFQHYSSEPFQL